VKQLSVFFICALFLALNSRTQTSVQFVHCAGDTALGSVDVWLDTIRITNDLDFRHSTNYRLVDFSSVGSVLSVTPSTSIDTTLAYYRDTVHLEENSKHQIFLHGSVSAGYNPAIPFNIDIHSNARVAADEADNSDVTFFNGITDMGSLQLFETSVINNELISGLSHSQHSPYIAMEGLNYFVQLQDSTSVVLREFKMSLAEFGLRDSAFTIALTGFKDPASNNNGAPIRMEVVPNQGGQFESFSIAMANVQIINNSVDPGLSTIDIYSQENLITDNLNFRSGTSYLELPSGIETEIGIARGSSSGVADTLISITVSLRSNDNYVLVVQGMDDASLPSFKPLSNLFFESKLHAATGSNTEFITINGSPDLPQIDIKENAVINDYIIQDLDYGMSSGYSALPSSIYQIELQSSSSNAVVKTYSVDLSSLGGISQTWIVSGLSDTLNSDSTNDVGIWVHGNTAGKLVEMSNVTGLQPIDNSTIRIFPNPTSDYLHINGGTKHLTYRIISSCGVLVKSGNIFGPDKIRLSSLPSGQYHLQLIDEKSIKNETFFLVR
jgi:hypothetical protein